MSYYTARELLGANGEHTGRWHYTVAWGDGDGTRVAAVGHCAHDCPGHDTPKAAYAHYRQYLLDERTRYVAGENATEQHRCEAPDCGAWTTGAAFVGSYEVHYLCDAHRDQAHLAPLVVVGDAWETA